MTERESAMKELLEVYEMQKRLLDGPFPDQPDSPGAPVVFQQSALSDMAQTAEMIAGIRLGS